MKSRLSIVAAGLLLLVACVGETQSLTDEGRGFPDPEVTFPATATAGSVQTAELTVTNPGPGDMGSLVVAFSRLGDPELPVPIVDVSGRDEDGAVRDVSPKPNAVSPDGVIYTFEGIDVGESVTIEFELTIPSADGPAGNAILVYDGGEPDRARGVRIETEVGG